MLADSLRKSILQAAIEGKLTEREPGDGDARDLLAEIQKEKTRLVREGKIRRSTPLPPVTDDEIPFDIPDNWCWVRFGEVVINRDAEREPVSEYERTKREKIYDYYGASGIIDKIDGYLFSEDLLLIGEDGANLLNRSTPIAFIARGKYWVNNHAHVLQMPNGVDISYLCWYINAISLAPYVTGTAQPKMNQQKMNSIPVVLPPLAEQRRIVARLEERLSCLDEVEKAQKQLDADREVLRKSLLQAAIEGKLTEREPGDGDARDLLADIQEEKARLVREGKIRKSNPLPPVADDEIPFDIPENWCWVRLGDCTFNHGQKVPDKDFTYIDIGSINNRDNKLGSTDNILSPKEAPSRARKIVFEGDVIYATVRPYLHNACVIDKKIAPEPIVSTGFAVLSMGNSISNRYLLWALLSPMFDNYANDTENSKGVAYPAINDSKLQQGIIPLPPLAEQRRIVARLEELFAMIGENWNLKL